MRQKEDQVFSEALLCVRLAQQTDEDTALLQSRISNFSYPIDTEPSLLAYVISTKISWIAYYFA